MSQLLERILTFVASFPDQKIVGVGDLILDQYRRGKATGLSPEAPAIDLLNPGLLETPGGAAVVAWNVGHLGGSVAMIGVLGNDPEAASLRRMLTETPGVELVAVEDPTRPTTLKLRYYHDQFQVLRVSHESREPLSPVVARDLLTALRTRVSNASALFVEDYGKGLLDPEFITALQEIRRTHPDLPIVFDPKVGNHHVYRPGMCTVLKPNWKEACQLVGAEWDRANREDVARALADQYECDVLITLGSAGTLVFERAAREARIVPTRPREAFDVAGAGDTTLAAATLALAAGASLTEAALIANLAGGIVVEKSGTAYATAEELLTELRHPKTQELLRSLPVPAMSQTRQSSAA
jgi:rfaE bifunctional protein kinase chain/domain